MTLAIVTAIGLGLGLAGLVASVRVKRPSLASIVRELSAREDPFGVEELTGRDRVWRFDRRVGRGLAASMRQRGHPGNELATMLMLTETSFDTLCCQAVLGGLAGLVMPALSWALLTTGGFSVPVFVPLWASLLLASSGSLLPLVVKRSQAGTARRAARRTVGTFLDLVVLSLAGGMGVESALIAAADIGDGHVSRRIAGALALSRDAGETPWSALDGLGRDLGIGELNEIAAAVSLAGSEGARIRATLAAKAASIRRHELADAEAEANAVTERLFLPGVLLMVGFLLFIGYPAYARITGGF